MNQEIRKMFCDLLGEDRVFTEELMSQHTTFKIGGPADYFLVPEKSEDVGAIVRLCKKEGIPYFILGNGSNLLVGDGGYRGVVIQIYKNMSAVKAEGTTITAQAGALLSAVAAAAKNASLTGFEFAGGIPGTIGGAAVMNAGAYGGDQEAIRETMKDLTIRRTTKQPLEYPSAGSTFKRPEGYFAGKLIMDSGLAGYQVGGAQVSEKHCGFVINAGGATAKDVRTLMDNVRDIVYKKYGITLEPEVKFLGDFE